jgi:hypothetical protein
VKNFDANEAKTLSGFVNYVELWFEVGDVLKRRVSDAFSETAFRAAAYSNGVRY